MSGKYNITVSFRPSFFYKGLLLAVTKENTDAISPVTILLIQLYKTYVNCKVHAR